MTKPYAAGGFGTDGTITARTALVLGHYSTTSRWMTWGNVSQPRKRRNHSWQARMHA